MSEATIDVAEALNRIATSLKYLGNGDAATTMGAIEALSMKQYEGATAIANALSEVASALRDVAEAIREREVGA